MTLSKEMMQTVASKAAWLNMRSRNNKARRGAPLLGENGDPKSKYSTISGGAADVDDNDTLPLSKVITPAPNTIEDYDEKPPLWLKEGAIPSSTTTSLPPRVIMSKLQVVLNENLCQYKALDPFSLKCEKDDLRFQIDINQLPAGSKSSNSNNNNNNNSSSSNGSGSSSSESGVGAVADAGAGVGMGDMNVVIIKRLAGNPWAYKQLSNCIFMAFKS
jgi:hypothetical protein